MSRRVAVNATRQKSEWQQGHRSTARRNGLIDVGSDFLALQHSAGNRALTGLLHSRASAISEVGANEHKDVPRQPAARPSIPSQQRVAQDVVDSVVRSRGEPLNPATRTFMESRLGHDFSQVRVHTDSSAAESAKAVNARAYTVGEHVVFGSGQFAPATGRGQLLLAHELAHVAQWLHARGAGDSARKAISESSGASEHAATAAASQVTKGGVANVGTSPEAVLSRQVADPTGPPEFYATWEDYYAAKGILAGSTEDPAPKPEKGVAATDVAQGVVRGAITTALDQSGLSEVLKRVDEVQETFDQAGGGFSGVGKAVATLHPVYRAYKRAYKREYERVQKTEGETADALDLILATVDELNPIYKAAEAAVEQKGVDASGGDIALATVNQFNPLYHARIALGKAEEAWERGDGKEVGSQATTAIKKTGDAVLLSLALAHGITSATGGRAGQVKSLEGKTPSQPPAASGPAKTPVSKPAKSVQASKPSLTSKTSTAVEPSAQTTSAQSPAASPPPAAAAPNAPPARATAPLGRLKSPGRSITRKVRNKLAAATMRATVGLTEAGLQPSGVTGTPVKSVPTLISSAKPSTPRPGSVAAPSARPQATPSATAVAPAGAKPAPATAPLTAAPEAVAATDAVPPSATSIAAPQAGTLTGTPAPATPPPVSAPAATTMPAPVAAAASTPAPAASVAASTPAPVAAAAARTPAQAAAAYAARWGGRLVDTNNALAGIFTRVRRRTLRVDARAAANELRQIHKLLTEGMDGRVVSAVEVVPSSSAGRTPDLVVRFADGTQTRVEARAATSAPRAHVRPKVPTAGVPASSGATARALAEETARRPVSASDITQALIAKARRGQLRAPLPNVAAGGTVAHEVTHANVTPAMIDTAVNNAAPQLGADIERITISYLTRASAAAPLRREVLVYARQGNTYVRTP